MDFDLTTPPHLSDPLLGFRFGVFFFGKAGISHPLDFRFQSVSGLSVNVQVSGGGGVGTSVVSQVLPEKLAYSQLVLKRGRTLRSSLSQEIQKSLNEFRFHPRNVLLSVLNEDALPVNSWLFMDAFPVRWSISGIEAENTSVLIEEMELNYTSFKAFNL